MSEHCTVERFSAPGLSRFFLNALVYLFFPLDLESGSVDHKARKRIEELFLLTDEIIETQKQTQATYDSRLYRKYKQLKEINKKLQEKLIHQHCSGCNCNAQPGGGIMRREEEPTSTRGPVVQKKRKTICEWNIDEQSLDS
jgi:hypothetical protein